MSGIHIAVLFGLVVLLVGFYFAMKEHFKESVVSNEDDFITTLDKKLEKHLNDVDVGIDKKIYLISMIVGAIAVGILGRALIGSDSVAVFMGCLGLMTPEVIIFVLKTEKQKKFEERYAKSLEQLSSSLRAGMSLSQAVDDVANCKFVHESMRKKYAKISSDLQMGLTVAEAFHRFEEGTGSQDAKDLTVSIDVQSDVGGHESDVIKEVADKIRDRVMLRREVKSVFASTSAMCWMMDVICPVVAIGFTAMNQSYLELYFSSPLYTMAFIGMLVMMLIGSIINHATMARIKKGA